LIRKAVQASMDAGFVTEDIALPGQTVRSTSEVGDWLAAYIKGA